MKVLMMGWEFPPYNIGGLGTACHGIVKGLSKHDVDVLFLLPQIPYYKESCIKGLSLIGVNNIDLAPGKVKVKRMDAILVPYFDPSTWEEEKHKYFIYEKDNTLKPLTLYGKDIFNQIQKYAEQCEKVALAEDFDIIHAHDWMTFAAGVRAKEASGKPLVIHVHATEFDRTGGHPNQQIYDTERWGMHTADKIISVSNFTKGMIVQHYGIDPAKVEVVHNAVDKDNYVETVYEFNRLREKFKIVLFLGRITIQKGPDWFLHIAARILHERKDVMFVFVGTGDMENRIIEQAATMGIANHIIFAGHIPYNFIDKVYQVADIYIMPSISEPFGITPLEAMKNKIPTIISKQSGVAEVVNNCVKLDFWDCEKIAKEAIKILNNPELKERLVNGALEEVNNLNWDDSAAKCITVYNNVLRDSSW